MSNGNTVFDMIARGEVKSYTIMEDSNHKAFLDIAPIRKGQTIVIPKAHQPSRFSDVSESVMCSTLQFAQEVAKLLESKLEGVDRVLVVIEGFDIAYFHVKLYPSYINAEHQPLTPAGTRATAEDLEEVRTLLSS